MTVHRPEDRTAQRSRELATRLFEYLQKLAELRTRPIRDLDEYAETLWFDQIPPEPECRIVTGTPPADPLTWISIDRPRDVRPPSLPEVLAPWVDQQELQDATADPQLRGEADAADSHQLDEHPEIQASWERYRTTWDRWAAEHRRLEPVVEAYKQLFEIEQLGSQLGEQYETVIGLGLLTWSGPAGAIRRHLLTMPAQVRFEAETGQITVGASLEGTRLRFEEDMLEGEQLPSRDLVRSLGSRLEQLDAEPWDRVVIDSSLRAWVNAAHTQGIYDPGLAPQGRGDDFPKVTFAPALILRRRTQRSLVEFYARVLEQLRDDRAAVPPTIRDVVEILDDDQQEQDDAWGDDDGEVYFPLPANDEQQRIVERLARHRGVVVQGPPGTGKSHTIANLITHLLASGKRVLVTSHTARALRVLKDKLPEDIADLCVSVADEGRRGVGELERSVQALLARAEDSRWQDHAIAERVDRLRGRVRDNENQRRGLLASQRAIREREIDTHRPPSGDYGGTLARISEQLRFEERSYGWLRERPEGPAPLGDEEALELLHLLRTVGEDAAARARQSAPEQTAVAAPSQVAELIDELQRAERATDEFAAARALPVHPAAAAAPAERRRELAEAVARLVRARNEVLRGREPWLPAAVAAVLDGRTFEWAELARQTFDGLARIGDDPTTADRVRLQGHEGFHPGALREQARSLADHLSVGGRIGGLLKAAPVRAAQPMLATVRVDGLPPDSLERLTNLICVLDTDAHLGALERQWGSMLLATDEASYSARAMRLGQAASVLNTAFELSDPRGIAEAAAQAIAGLVPPTWSDPGQIESLRQCLAGVEADEAVAELRGELDAVARPLRSAAISGSAAHECAEAVRALETRDVAAYASAVAGLDELYRTRNQVHRRDLLVDRLRANAPGLAQELEADPGASHWDHRLAEFERAWNWARADTWYRRLVEAGDEREVGERLRACDERSLKLTGEVAANLAWQYCLRRMTLGESMHLRAYHLAMRRYGKGTGKYAGTHLIEAQRHMDACQGAVPAWIMPTYRVAETISPRPHAFDVVIVDEASQSGVDALFLLWLAPKIVVVGDDRQISPDNVGMPHDVALRYQNEYLGAVELRDVLGLDNSLFDQAAARYQGRIWLREHFRCMPEIIEFSNRLSYPDHRLVPLREFGTDRLPPLKAVHVLGASVRGASDNRKVNEAEAEAIVEQIEKCCADPAYDGRSMGVVSLLGDAQAHRIRNLLVERIGPGEMVARRIKCGNAYDFQGDERNVMFLSLVVAPTPDGRRIPALGSTSARQRFNVAASRAKDQMWLFHSVQLRDLNPECVRWMLLDHCMNPPSAPEERDVGEVRPDVLREPFDSLFEQRVYLRLREREYTVVPQYEVHNFRIDLVVVGERSRLAVECDGEAWHGPDQYARDVARQRDLERCGWRFFRLRESEFYRDPDAALAPLWDLLRERGIWPRSHEPEPTPIEPVEPVPVATMEAPTSLAFAWFGPQEHPQEAPTSPLAAAEPPTEEPSHLVPGAEVESEKDVEVEDDLDEAPWLESEEDEQLTLVETSVPNPLGLDPYVSWRPTPQPDPRSASRATLIHALTGIVAEEGPIVARRAYRLLLRASGGQRLGKLTKAPLNRAAAEAVRGGILADENPTGRQTQIDRVLRLPGSPKVRIRARGDRTLQEIPMSEVAALMRRLRTENPRLSPAELRRAVLDAYGLVRMTAKAALYLGECMSLSFGEATP